MSFAAQKWAMALTVGSSTAKAVLLALAYYADEDGICWPSQETLARDTEFTSRAVRTAIGKLQELGLISSEKRHRRDGSRASDMIKLAIGAEPNRNLLPVVQAEGGSGGEEPPSGGAERRSRGSEGGSGHEPSSNHQGNHQPTSRPTATAGASRNGETMPAVQPLHNIRSRLETEGLETICEITGRSPGMGGKLIARFLRMAYDEASIVLALIREAKSRGEVDPSMWIEDQLRARILRSREPVPLPGAPTGYRREPPMSAQTANLVRIAEKFAAEQQTGVATHVPGSDPDELIDIPDDDEGCEPEAARGEDRGVAWASGGGSDPSDALLRAAGFGGHDSRASRALRRSRPPRG